MSVTCDDNPNSTITNTLISALTQSQGLVRQLEDQIRITNELRKQNDELRSELANLRPPQFTEERLDDAAAQFDRFFRESIEKQTEIDRLKKELAGVQRKERKWRAKNLDVSSPLVTSDDSVAVPSLSPRRSASSPIYDKLSEHKPSSPPPDVHVQQTSSPPRKRARTTPMSDGPLQNFPNHQDVGRKLPTKGRDRANRGAEAIPTVTEDGEDHNGVDEQEIKQHKTSEKRDGAAINRLATLLTAPSPTNAIALFSEHRSSKSNSPGPKPNVVPPLCKSSSDLAKDGVSNLDRSKSQFLPSRRRLARGPEDDEPLRNRPVKRLNLSHFKLNPNVNSAYDYAYDETIRNRTERKCLPGCTRRECCGGQMEALAATLGPDAKLSEDDLLLYLLGPGSEDQNKTLTSVARDNFLQEARAKRVADTCGRMHRSMHQRAASPADFWNSDMPGTQEEEKNREEARWRERDEIQIRYREACKEDGKWVFTDE